jgi:hypothetical protein
VEYRSHFRQPTTATHQKGWHAWVEIKRGDEKNEGSHKEANETQSNYRTIGTGLSRNTGKALQIK